MALPSFKVMTLTDAAANRVKDIIATAEQPIVGVRVGVKNGGCAGMSYTMEYAESVNALDEVVEDKGVTVLIDPKAVLFLLGTEMDFQTTKLSSQFVFNNPNQTSACGCGESVAITPANARGPSAGGIGHGRRGIQDLFQELGPVRIRQMFGGYGIYARRAHVRARGRRRHLPEGGRDRPAAIRGGRIPSFRL